MSKAVVFFLVLFNFYKVSVGRVWPSHYTQDHLQLHKEIEKEKTHPHLEDFQIIIPSMIDHNHDHVSFAVKRKRPNRIRRDVVGDETSTNELELRYSFSGFGEKFRLHLEPNNRLLAPGFSVTVLRNNSEENHTGREATGCHYQGWITSHQSRPVAMSTCDGLVGLLRTGSDEFFLEPVPSHLNHSFVDPMQPHMIYTRRHIRKGKHRLHYCGKKGYHPVMIPHSAAHSTIKLLSNGEVELETEEKLSKRYRRSISSASNENGVVSSTVSRQRPIRKVVETLVVADRAMIEKHNRDYHDVTTYILTVMNMVSSLFSDHSLDGNVEFALMGLIMLDENSSLHLDHKADVSLANFCKWQYNFNHSRGKVPDHSILITGIDICVHKNGPCETLGLAQIGGMCNRRHSCTINEDMGLGLAFTIAHESGHSFGMMHDGQANSCGQRDGHIMSPTLNGLNGVFTWSSCSREALTNFLNNRNSLCLDNGPDTIDEAFETTHQLPGELYGVDQQCQWQFGPVSSLCHYRYARKLNQCLFLTSPSSTDVGPIFQIRISWNSKQIPKVSVCQTLWCQTEDGSMCETKYLPAAEGTTCGDGLWCRRGVCVDAGSSGPSAVDGNWSEFGPWSSCTRTCGRGAQHRVRTCTEPPPKYGGRHCEGKDKIYQLCNVEKCSHSGIDFRSKQCANFNNKLYRRQLFHWIPFMKYSRFGRNSCNLLCKAKGFGFFDLFADKVIDGTPCSENSLEVCIDGKCQHVGCDNVLGSNATYDACGVCNGGYASCITVTGKHEKQHAQSGYHEVVRIPRGAHNVKVWEESCCTHSYIAVKSATPPFNYFLNGDWNIDLSPTHKIAGVKWIYKRESFHKEQLHSTGHNSLNEDIIVEILTITKNPGIRYSYSIRKVEEKFSGREYLPSEQNSSDIAVFEWNVIYGDCSSSCAQGHQKSIVTCTDANRTAVDDVNCKHIAKPQMETQKCNSQPCPPRWVVGHWKECSQTCGDGFQRREVTCKSMTSSGETDATNCDIISKPVTARTCHHEKCSAEWFTGQWSSCSRKCGKGRRKRRVYCQRGVKKVRQSACDVTIKPRRKEKCVITKFCHRKYEWFATTWEKCSENCGNGFQRRRFKCRYQRFNGKFKNVSTRKCKKLPKPQVSLKQNCRNANCPIEEIQRTSMTATNKATARNLDFNRPRSSSHWVAGTWQKCTVTCGGGVQLRAVKCFNGGEALLSSACSAQHRPISERQCNSYRCDLSASNEQDNPCTDNYIWCSLVPQHGQCLHSFFGAQCCKSCSSGAG